jgi:TolA-binding protein
MQLGDTNLTSVATSGQLTTGDVTYPKTHGIKGQVLGTLGSGELVWLDAGDIYESAALDTQELEEQVASLQEQLDEAAEAKDQQIASLQEQLKSQQEELLVIVQSQQEQIAQLQRMVEHRFVAR